MRVGVGGGGGGGGLHGCHSAASLNRPKDKKNPTKTQGTVTNRHQEWTGFCNNPSVSATGDWGWEIACKYSRCVSASTAAVCMDRCVLRVMKLRTSRA